MRSCSEAHGSANGATGAATRGRQGRERRAGGAVVGVRMLRLKERLGSAQEHAEETDIDETVDSLRKHATAGNTAKSLVKQWKKHIPPEDKSCHRRRKQNTEKEERKASVSKEVKSAEKPKASVVAYRSANSADMSKKLTKKHTCEKTHTSRGSDANKERSSSHSKRTSQGTEFQGKESDLKERISTGNKKASEKPRSSVADKESLPLKEKPSKDVSKQESLKCVKKPKEKFVRKNKAELSSEEEFEPPTMSFESYLTYDQVTTRRKRKACSTGEQSKKCSKQKNSSLPQGTSTLCHAKKGEDVTNCEGDESETPNKKAKVTSLQDLLNLPLPKFLTGLSMSSPPYAEDFKASQASVTEESQQVSEMAHFTGRRLNSKMQVYSGSKPASLPKMLTLHEQCIRVLQNNIDCLHDMGGVPFDILEPVLTCCTPEQLLRIEEFNPTFTEETNYLWKKHCQRDFRNETLQECESWREMYLRLFNQREEKLKQLTKNILSAQSKKPKGRQVKMAYVIGTAEPPRNNHQQQETYGTAGPVTQFHPTGKCKTELVESRDRNKSNPIPARSGGSATSSIMTQDGKKPTKKIAPIMKKTLKALKSRIGPR